MHSYTAANVFINKLAAVKNLVGKFKYKTNFWKFNSKTAFLVTMMAV